MDETHSTYIVEAHRECREVLALCLEMCGFGVAVAASGNQALAELRDTTPRCVVIDTALPDRPALDVVRVLRANRRFDRTTIVLVSTWLPQPDRDAALGAGVDAVLLKPFLMHELLGKMVGARPTALDRT